MSLQFRKPIINTAKLKIINPVMNRLVEIREILPRTDNHTKQISGISAV
jgi:hypothetical protein